MRATIVKLIAKMIRLLQSCTHVYMRLSMKSKLMFLCITFGILLLWNPFAVFTHMFERSYHDQFTYPYEGDIQSSVEALKNSRTPDIEPINQYNYSYIHDIRNRCVDKDYDKLRIIFLIKSACRNFASRRNIRNSWGSKQRLSDVPARIVFLLGKPNDDDEMQTKIENELKIYQDIMQANFIDTYYNNTIKTMMGFKWVMNHCLNAEYYMFVDDDMYVSVKNVLRFIRNPELYPNYREETSGVSSVEQEIRESDKPSTTEHLNASTIKNTFHDHEYNSLIKLHRDERIGTQEEMTMRHESAWTTDNGTIVPINEVIRSVIIHKKTTRGEESTNSRKITPKLDNSTMDNSSDARKVFDSEFSHDVRLFSGCVKINGPAREKSSTWYVPLREYPFDLWPPFIPAGAYILSKATLVDLYYTSFYTKHFRFDDVFLGLVAKKANIELSHSEHFHISETDYAGINFEYAIAVHGFGDIQMVLEMWNKQKLLNNV